MHVHNLGVIVSNRCYVSSCRCLSLRVRVLSNCTIMCRVAMTSGTLRKIRSLVVCNIENYFFL